MTSNLRYPGLTFLFFLAGLVLYIPFPSKWMRSGTIHVSPQGFDGFPGNTRYFAVRSLQRAFNIVSPGESVLIWPGLYYENPILRRQATYLNPISIKARIPQTAILTYAAHRVPKLTWRAIGRNLYQTDFPWRVDSLRINGVAAYRAKTYEILTSVCKRTDDWSSFYYKHNKLALCVGDGQDPEEVIFSFHRPYPKRTNAGGHQVANMWVDGSNIRVHGLHFDFSVMAALQLWDSKNITIQGNRFTNSDVAITNHPSLSPAHNIFIVGNTAEYPPLYQWSRNWLTWKELYSYSNSSLTWIHGKNIIISGNLVCEAGDAIKLTTENNSKNVISLNYISYVVDDAFEFDGVQSDVDVFSNTVLNFFVAVSLSPMTGGPVAVHNNLFIAEALKANNTILKIVSGPISDVMIFSNHISSKSLVWGNPRSLSKVSFYFNTIFGQHVNADLSSSGLQKNYGNTINSYSQKYILAQDPASAASADSSQRTSLQPYSDLPHPAHSFEIKNLHSYCPLDLVSSP